MSDVLYDRDPLVTEFINQGIQDVNSEAPSVGAKITKWIILENDFSVDGGELGECRVWVDHGSSGPQPQAPTEYGKGLGSCSFS